MSKSAPNSRREFFKHIIGLTGVALLAPAFFSSTVNAEEKRRAKPGADAGGGADKLAEPGKGVAGALGYMHKSNQAGKSCSNCMLYTSSGKDVGKCTVIADGLVKAGGYCNSWSKKA